MYRSPLGTWSNSLKSTQVTAAQIAVAFRVMSFTVLVTNLFALSKTYGILTTPVLLSLLVASQDSYILALAEDRSYSLHFPQVIGQVFAFFAAEQKPDFEYLSTLSDPAPNSVCHISKDIVIIAVMNSEVKLPSLVCIAQPLAAITEFIAESKHV